MRLGLDLRSVEPSIRADLASEADRLGLWAVLLDGADALVAATAIAVATRHIHLAVMVDTFAEHPFTLAEEVAVLDHLCQRRAVVIAGGPGIRRLKGWLGGEIVDGLALTPPPAQTAIPVWSVDSLAVEPLTGDLIRDRMSIDRRRDDGTTHLFVSWPGRLPVLARHLATRAAVPAFPQLVADLADRFDPPNR